MKNSVTVVRILLNILIFTEFEISLRGKEFSSLSHTCQWGPVRYPSSKTCTEFRCAPFEGFLIPGTDQLVCFHYSKKSSVIDIKGEKKNSKQCGYKTQRISRPCNPIITCEKTTEEECVEKCKSYTVYVTRVNAEVSHCGETSEIITRTLDSSGNHYFVNREDGPRNSAFNCSCGFGEEGKEVLETQKRQRSRLIPNEDAPDKMVVSCPITFVEFHKSKCKETCRKLKGIYSRQDKKFICFHSERKVTMIEATAEYCQCGVAFDDRKKLHHDGICPPDRIIQSNNIVDCPKRCESYIAYVYSPRTQTSHTSPKSNTLYCEYPSYIFKDLSYEIRNIVAVKTKDGKNNYPKYECFCGLRLSQSEINSKINLGELYESSLINDKPKYNVRNDSEIRNISNIRFNEKEVSDLQLSAELDIIQNEEIGDLLKDSDFLYDLIDHDRNTSNNNSIDFEIPTIGKKRSYEINWHDVDEVDRGKKKAVPNIDGSVETAEFKIPSISGHHTAWQNKDLVEERSSSQVVGFDRDVIQNENLYSGISDFGIPDLGPEILPQGDFNPPPMPCRLRSNIINDNLKKRGISHNIGFVINQSPNMGMGPNVTQDRILIGNNTSQYVGHGRKTPPSMEVGPSVSQNRGLIGNNTSQYVGHGRKTPPSMEVGPSVSQNRGLIGNNTSQYVGHGRKTPPIMEVGPSVSQNRGLIGNNTSQYVGHGRKTPPSMEVGPSVSQNRGLIRNITTLNIGVGPSVSQDRRIIGNNTSPYLGVINPNTTRGNYYHTTLLRDISTSARYPSFSYEDNLSHGPFFEFILPNARMEMNEPVRENTTGGNASRNTGHSRNMSQNMKLSNTSREMGMDSNMPQNRGIINSNSLRTSDDNTFQDIPAGIGYPAFTDECTPGSFPDSPSDLFPNATMEINEVLRPGR